MDLSLSSDTSGSRRGVSRRPARVQPNNRPQASGSLLQGPIAALLEVARAFRERQRQPYRQDSLVPLSEDGSFHSTAEASLTQSGALGASSWPAVSASPEALSLHILGLTASSADPSSSLQEQVLPPGQAMLTPQESLAGRLMPRNSSSDSTTSSAYGDSRPMRGDSSSGNAALNASLNPPTAVSTSQEPGSIAGTLCEEAYQSSWSQSATHLELTRADSDSRTFVPGASAARRQAGEDTHAQDGTHVIEIGNDSGAPLGDREAPFDRNGDQSQDSGVESDQSQSHLQLQIRPPQQQQQGQGQEQGQGQGQQQPQQRYDLSQAARWLEQGLPFCLLVVIVFAREHLTGFLTFLWLTVVLVRSNDIIRKQAVLKYERSLLQIIGVAFVLLGHVASLQGMFDRSEILLPLSLHPIREQPKFWHAVFIVFVNDHLVRFFGMAVKCLLLAVFSLNKRRSFRRQAQILTLVEYCLLLYRSLVPVPVWYRYFLNERLGHLFSSLVTGLYLTFKLSSIVDRLILFLTSLRQVLRREVQYGAHSTPEEVLKAGEMCSICHDKMLSPITLRCHHVFCEDCVSEWFEREQTCPLCRTVVRAPTLKSFGDASTSLTMQVF